MNGLELFLNPYINVILVITIVQTILFVYSMYYVKIKYPYFLKPKMKNNFTPKVGIFIPCKGIDLDMENNLKAFLQQDYPDFIVTFITEDENDPANFVIKKILNMYPKKTRHVIAGYAINCGQKNYNLLQGIKEDKNSEIFVFCDADSQPKSDWLSNLIRPISMGRNVVATGIPWSIPLKPNLASVLMSLFMGYQAKGLLTFKFIWGGSIAINKTTFYEIGTDKMWSRAVVDDVSLHNLILKNNLKVIPVVECFSRSFNRVNSIKQVIDWFSRQIIYLKIYKPHLWFVSLSQIINFLIITITPILLFISWRYEILLRESLVSLMFTLYLLMIHNNICLLYDEDLPYPVIWRQVLFIADFVALYSLLKTVFMKDLYWRGILYELEPGGIVKKVKRLYPTIENKEKLQTIELQEKLVN